MARMMSVAKGWAVRKKDSVQQEQESPLIQSTGRRGLVDSASAMTKSEPGPSPSATLVIAQNFRKSRRLTPRLRSISAVVSRCAI